MCKTNITPTQFPDDENGEVLRRMHDGGDDLTSPRIIEFCFIFADRSKALDFAEHADDRNDEICISYFKEREMWQAIVKRHMLPQYAAISSMEARLSKIAALAGGKADGWGCLQVQKNEVICKTQTVPNGQTNTSHVVAQTHEQ